MGWGRVVVRTSGGNIYIIVNNAGTVRMFKSSNGGTSFAEQDNAHAQTSASGTPIAASIDSSDIIHVFFRNSSGNSVRYNTFATSTDLWGTSEQALAATSGSNLVAVACAIDSNNIPHLVVARDTFSSNNWQYSNRVGGTWQTGVTTTLSNGFNAVDIIVDNGNIPEIVVYTNTSDKKINAYLGNLNNATSFTLQTLTSTASVLGSSNAVSIAMDSSNNTWVSYIEASNIVTIQKHNSGDAWSTWQTALNNSGAGKGTSLAINGTDVYVFYEKNSNSNIVYDKYTGSWLGETVLESGTFHNVRAKWSEYNNSGGTSQIDFAYDNGTSTIWDKLSFSVLVSVSDSISVAENLQIQTVDNINVSDSVSVSESVQMQIISFVSVNDSVSVAENIQMQEVLFISVNDSVTITENVQILKVLKPNVSDSVTITESVTIREIFNISVSDSVAVAEVVSFDIRVQPSVFDAVTVTESVQMQILDFENVFDSVSVSEFVQLQIVSFVNVSDNVSVAENVNINEVLLINVSDAISVVEAVTIQPQTTTSVGDDITVSESVQLQIVSFINVSDDISVLDTGVFQTAFVFSVADSVSVSENVSVVIQPRTFYWVGGTGAWNGTNTTNWAISSGGTGGQGIPTANDNVVFDGNSGVGTVTIQTAVATCGSLDASAYTGNITQNQNLNIGNALAGDFILGSGMTFTWTAGTVKLISTKAVNNINLNGNQIGTLTFNGAGAKWVLQSDVVLVATAGTSLTQGTVDLNGHDFLSDTQTTSSTAVRQFIMNGGRIRLRGTGAVWPTPAGTLTFDNTIPGSIRIEDTSASAKSFSGGTVSYPKIEVLGAVANGTVTFAGAFTTNAFIFNPNTTILFTSGTTFTASAFTATGSLGNTISIAATTPMSAATISIASGIISCDYLILQDSAATGGAAFYAGSHSTNVSGNSGWIFSDAPLGPNVFDSIAITEATTIQIVDFVNVFDSISVSESVQIQLVHSINAFDSVSISEAVQIEIIENLPLVFDDVTVSESVQFQIVDFISVSDSVVVSESVQIQIISAESVFDIVTVNEFVQMQIISFVNTHDDVTVSEATQFQVIDSIVVSDSILVSEVVAIQIVFQPSGVFDAVTVSESVQMMLISFINVFDTVLVTDTTQEQKVLSINVHDSITVTDIFSGGIFIPIVVFVGTVKLGWKFSGYTLTGEREAGYVVSEALNKTVDLQL